MLFLKIHENLPENIQSRFVSREGTYNLRGICLFERNTVWTVRKSFCVSVCGVKLCNNLSVELQCEIV